MTKKKNVHVVKKDDKWHVKREGAKRSSSTHDTQAEARKAGQRIAKRDGVENITHRPNGQIRDKDSYGNDPYPPKG